MLWPKNIEPLFFKSGLIHIIISPERLIFVRNYLSIWKDIKNQYGVGCRITKTIHYHRKYCFSMYVLIWRIMHILSYKSYQISKSIQYISKKFVPEPQLTRIYWKWSPSKYCSTLEIIFVHYNYEFKNFFQELCFFIAKYALYGFSFNRPIRLTKAQSL
jgi:hypothetical protein